jgi:hypothetical protein
MATMKEYNAILASIAIVRPNKFFSSVSFVAVFPQVSEISNINCLIPMMEKEHLNQHRKPDNLFAHKICKYLDFAEMITKFYLWIRFGSARVYDLRKIDKKQPPH